jgi:UDP:flavonoid glycosyltransferase YjiC (YdhE family)
MHITILAFGSRGDVQPCVALGLGLERAGHRVRLAALSQFETFVAGRGLDFFSLGVDLDDLQSAGRAFKANMERMQENFWQASQGTQAIIFSTLGINGYHVAEKLEIPCLWALTIPIFGRTRTRPALLPPLPLGSGYNLLAHILTEQGTQQTIGRLFNSWRQTRLDLPPIPLHRWPYTQLRGQPVPMLYCYSTAILPRPPDWSEHAHVTGYWFLGHAPDWQPPAGLVGFLESGPPPIYVGFGSTTSRDPEETIRIVMDALRQSGQRGVIAAGREGLSQPGLPGEVFVTAAIPHDWLFPRMTAVVHHGGAGTTGAGLRAGVPSIVVPATNDQPFWGRQVEALGAGPTPIPRRRLTADRLARAISVAVTDQSMRKRAAELGETIRAEDGVGNAVGIVNQTLGASPADRGRRSW